MADYLIPKTTEPEAGTTSPASFVIYPQQQKEFGMGKFGAFMLGVVAGAVALGATAAVVEGLDNSNSDIYGKFDDNRKDMPIVSESASSPQNE